VCARFSVRLYEDFATFTAALRELVGRQRR